MLEEQAEEYPNLKYALIDINGDGVEELLLQSENSPVLPKYDFDENMFFNDRMDILNEGLETLDINSRIAIKMKLRLDEYGDMIPSVEDPTKMVYKYQNNMKSIAEMLEVPVPYATKIYKEALKKITEYCRNQE